MSVEESVKIEVSFNAPIQNVWSAWTDPARVLRWFGSDPNGVGINAKLDVRKKGKFEITFQDSDHTEHTCSGHYQEISEPGKLIFTWKWKSEPDVESLVSVFLTPHGDRTQMQFEHEGVGTKSIHNYVSGWKGAFAKLERELNA